MDPITPVELARELGHDDGGRRVRAYLRERHGAHHIKNARWLLTPEQADDVRVHFV